VDESFSFGEIIEQTGKLFSTKSGWNVTNKLLHLCLQFTKLNDQSKFVTDVLVMKVPYSILMGLPKSQISYSQLVY